MSMIIIMNMMCIIIVVVVIIVVIICITIINAQDMFGGFWLLCGGLPLDGLVEQGLYNKSNSNKTNIQS